MGRKQKQETKPISTEELISKGELTSDNVIQLKLSTRKGTRSKAYN